MGALSYRPEASPDSWAQGQAGGRSVGSLPSPVPFLAALLCQVPEGWVPGGQVTGKGLAVASPGSTAQAWAHVEVPGL